MRINIVKPRILTDQHLIAEWNEHHMLIPMMVRSFHSRGTDPLRWHNLIPKHYVLGKGHAFFFYNKLTWLQCRRRDLMTEMLIRKMKPNAEYLPLRLDELNTEEFDRPSWCMGVWRSPTTDEIQINLSRINRRIDKKPMFYTWCGKGITAPGTRSTTDYKREAYKYQMER